jgi:hypothetical protein
MPTLASYLALAEASLPLDRTWLDGCHCGDTLLEISVNVTACPAALAHFLCNRKKALSLARSRVSSCEMCCSVSSGVAHQGQPDRLQPIAACAFQSRPSQALQPPQPFQSAQYRMRELSTSVTHYVHMHPPKVIQRVYCFIFKRRC